MSSVVLKDFLGSGAIDPSELVWKAAAIDLPVLELLRQRAVCDGRVIARDGAGLFTHGIAATIDLPRGIGEQGAARHAFELLSDLPPLDSPSCVDGSVCPIAIGALPFDSFAPSHLVIPTLAVYESAQQGAIAIAVGKRDLLDGIFEGLRCEGEGQKRIEPLDFLRPDQFSLQSVGGHEEFLSRVNDAITAIHSGALQKVVIAREVFVHANRPFSQKDLLSRMRVLHPSCAAFAIDGFVGASPELLCKKHGPNITSQPLAGTIPRSGDPGDDALHAAALMHSQKDRAEHRFVVDDIARELARFTAFIDVPGEPHLLELRNVTHLATLITATLPEDPDGAPLPSALEIVSSLHPTPAVAGVPREAALKYLATFETLRRDHFAGPVGWVDASGDGEWWIGIRSAMIDGCDARLLAGVGIVADSDPESELVETQLKFQAFLATAVRP